MEVSECSNKASPACTMNNCLVASEDCHHGSLSANVARTITQQPCGPTGRAASDSPLRCFIRLLEADMRATDAMLDIAGSRHVWMDTGSIKINDHAAGDLRGVHEALSLDNVDLGGDRKCSSPSFFSSPVTTTSDNSGFSQRPFDHKAVERARRRAAEHRKQQANMEEAVSVARRQERFGRRDSRLEQFLRNRLAAESLGRHQSGCHGGTAKSCSMSATDCVAIGDGQLQVSCGNDSSFNLDESSCVTPNPSDDTDEDLERLLLEEVGPEGLSGGRRPPRPYKEVPMEPEYSSVD